MPAKSVVSIEGNLRDFSKTSSDLADEREALDAVAMAEMLYNGNPVAGYAPQQGIYRAAGASQGGYRQSAPISSNEGAISTLLEAREDMLRRYASVSQDPVAAVREAMGIQKLEAQIISMGGEVDRFDPANYRSGLRSVEQSVDPKEMAKKVAEMTQQAYSLRPIDKIWFGANKTGKVGIAIKIACDANKTIHGTVIPKNAAFTGNEVIDFVPDEGRGRMTVKAPKNGYWEDVSRDYDVAWKIEQK